MPSFAPGLIVPPALTDGLVAGPIARIAWTRVVLPVTLPGAATAATLIAISEATVALATILVLAMGALVEATLIPDREMISVSVRTVGSDGDPWPNAASGVAVTIRLTTGALAGAELIPNRGAASVSV